MSKSKPPSKINIGIRTDELIKMRGRGEDGLAENPVIVDSDENGLVVEWRYPDCVAVVKHDGKMYRVVEVRDVEITT